MTDVQNDHYRQRLVALYAKYKPPMINMVDAVLARFKGKEEEAIRQAVERYGPEPSDAAPSGPVSSQPTISTAQKSVFSSPQITTAVQQNQQLQAKNRAKQQQQQQQ
eukprot:Hpha_TRINITY_DN15955_c2_g1::TRINITY_DN15955_c2_g1_i1::g.70851::m.70851